MHRIIIVLLSFFYQHSMNYQTVQVDFQFGSFKFYLVWTTLFHMFWALLCSCWKAHIFEATRTWHIQHEFSNCRCDIVCIWHNDNFLTRGWSRKSNLSSFQTLAPGLYAIMSGETFLHQFQNLWWNIWQGFLIVFSMCLALSPRRKSLMHNSQQVGSEWMQSPMGTQGKGILMLGADSYIVKDQKCTIIAEVVKKTCTNCRWRITCERLPCHFITF